MLAGRVLTVAVAGSVLFGLAACDAAASRTSEATSSARRESVTATGRRFPSSYYRKVVDVTAAKGGGNPNVLAVDSEGEVLLDESEEPTKSELLGAETLAVRTTDGGSVPIPTQDRSGHFQVIGGAVSSRWVVWQETRSTSLDAQPWQMYAYDRVSHRVRLLDRTANLSDGVQPPPTPGYTGPVIVGSRAYWVAVTGTTAELHPNVYTCKLQDCRPRLVANDAAFVTTDGTSALALSYDAAARRHFTKAQVVSSTDGAMARTVATVAVPSGLQPTGFAANSTAFIVTAQGQRTRMMVISRDSAKISRTIVGDKGEQFGYPVATDRYVAWAEGSGNSPKHLGGFVLIDNKTYLLGNTSGLYGLEGAGRYLVWQDGRMVGSREVPTERVVFVKK